VWDHFIDVVNSDDKYLDDTDVATLVNLFHDKHLFFLDSVVTRFLPIMRYT
jgi:hypothetical protein